MHKKEISLDEFRRDTSSPLGYEVDVDDLLGVCGASPVHVHYKAYKIMVNDVYPESINLINDENCIAISQVQKITKTIGEFGTITYEILCGYLKPLEMTVKIIQK